MMVIWLVVWNMIGLWLSIQLGVASSQLTKEYIFQRDCFTTNQGIFNSGFTSVGRVVFFFVVEKTCWNCHVRGWDSLKNFMCWLEICLNHLNSHLVGGFSHFYFPFHILGMSSCQLTLIFFRGVVLPETSHVRREISSPTSTTPNLSRPF